MVYVIFTGDICNVSSIFYKYSQIVLEILNKKKTKIHKYCKFKLDNDLDI